MCGASIVALGQQSDPALKQPGSSPIQSIQSLVRTHEYDRALELAQAALKNTPEDARLLTLEGIIFSIKADSRDALRAFEKALAVSPNNAAAIRGEAQLLYQAKDKRAIPLLERIVKTDPRDGTAHEMLANIEKQEGNCQASIAHFVASGTTLYTHSDSLEAYGYCLVQTKQPVLAIPVFETLAALLPQQTYPKFDLAVVLVQTRQYQAAVKCLQPLLESNQSDPDVLSLASEAYEAMGDTPKAVELLRQAIVLKPDNATLYNAFAAICLNHDSFQVGIDMVSAGLQRIADDPSLYLSRGLLYAQLANYDRAEEDFTRAEHLDSNGSISAFALDLAELQKAGSAEHHAEKSLSDIRSQLKTRPDSALLHYLLAKLLLEQVSEPGSPASAEAAASATRAIILDPRLVEARDLLAGMYLRSAQYSLAIAQCRAALQYTPADQSAMYHLIIALRHSPQSAEAGELASLVKRLSELQQATLQQDTDRKRFRLVEEQSEPAK